MISANLKGAATAVCSNMLFVLLFLHSGQMKPMSGTDVLAWRMAAMLCGLLVLVTATLNRCNVCGFVRGVGRDWRRWLLILLPTPILASLLWPFMWAPINGEGVAMGYFLFPLVMVLAGSVLFGEKLTPLQKAAVAAACAGVAAELWHTGTFSWTTVWAFGTYPAYYLIRRWQKVPALTGLLLDLLLIAPFALLYIFNGSGSLAMIAAQPQLMLFIVLLGAASALAMQLNLYVCGRRAAGGAVRYAELSRTCLAVCCFGAVAGRTGVGGFAGLLRPDLAGAAADAARRPASGLAARAGRGFTAGLIRIVPQAVRKGFRRPVFLGNTAACVPVYR